MNRLDRGISTAADAARLSTMKHRVGAALFVGKHLVSLGWNNRKTHPDNDSIFHWHHAETSALIGTNRIDLSRARLYVVRLGAEDDFRIAKPCKGCQKTLLAAGIRRVIYTDRRGKPQRMRLDK